MKTITKLMLMLSLITLIFSCSNKSNDLTPNQISDNLKQGSWSVSYYAENGKDETYKFNGYSLIFGNDNVLELMKGLQNCCSGSWYYENPSDDSSESNKKLVLNIFGDDVADKLQDDWLIIESTSDFFHLIDDNIEKQEVLKLSRKM